MCLGLKHEPRGEGAQTGRPRQRTSNPDGDNHVMQCGSKQLGSEARLLLLLLLLLPLLLLLVLLDTLN